MLSMTTTEETLSTGIREIAGALGGGVREESLVIIEGEDNSGKSVLSQHLAYGTLSHKNNAVVYYTIDNSAECLIAQMESMSLDVAHDFATDRLRIYAVGSSNVLEKAQETLGLLINHISHLPVRFNLVVVDSVTALMTRNRPVDKIDFLKSCKELCEQDRSIILVADTHIFERDTLARAYSISDYYLKLKSQDMLLETGQLDSRAIKVLGVTKLCGAERLAQEDIKFEIKPKIGIQILPFLKVRV
ncbi:ATPase domain-containing protein [Chloroflexota bacterium]